MVSQFADITFEKTLPHSATIAAVAKVMSTTKTTIKTTKTGD